jgi:LuxR family maltose regulon positive regulatory protein
MALGMLDEGEALLRSAIERLEKETPTEKIYWSLSAVHMTLGSILRRKILYTGNYEYVNFYQKGAYYAELGGFVQKPPLTVATLSSYVCCVSSPERGELERYIRALDEGIPWLEKCMSGCGQGSSDLARGELAFFQGNLQAAEENLLKAIPTAVKYDQFGIEDRSLFYLIRLYINQGNTEKIKSIYEQFKNRLEEPNFITRQIYYDIKTGWVLIQLGDPEQIASWLKNDFELSDHSSLVYGMEILVKAKYHLAMQEYPAALAVLKSQEHGLGNFILGRVEIKVLEAVCYYKMGSKEESFACLDAAWEAAAPNELFMPFTEQGKDMRTLTQAALREGATRIDKEVLSKIHLAASAYGKRLSIVIKQYRHEQKKEPVQELSHREHQILISLFEGLTGEEISAETNLSFNTVKSIIKRIYNKLGAINRVDAIRIASDLGLLDHQ